MTIALMQTRSNAMPSYQMKIPNGDKVSCYPGAEGCIENICHGVGHNTCQGGSMPLNPFGQDLVKNNFKWTQLLCQTDSDNDGFTNGEELGDPCCTWTVGNPLLNDGFVPSHPGKSESHQPASYVSPNNCSVAPPEKRLTAAFNDHEEKRMLEWIVKNYTLPKEETTYVDFVFNFNDDDHEIFHIAWGEAIIDIEWALHHFVVTGCSKKIEPENEGLPLEKPPEYCNLPLGGFAGWAPGATLWDMPVDSGVPIGKGVGIVAVSINVHYTDAQKHETTKSQDGVRLFYTPTLRQKTIYSTSPINLGTGPMKIPPQKSRYFIHRECNVRHYCDDEETLDCPAKKAAGLCSSNHDVKTLCPTTCGTCSQEEKQNIHVVGIFFHAHLLGREMYATVTRKNGDVQNLHSKPAWDYNDQSVYHFFGNNLTLTTGDRIDTTCVYNSMARDKSTSVGLSTYEEMCIHSIMTSHDSSTSSENFKYGAFSCHGNIWTGELNEEESGLAIAENHPENHAEEVWEGVLGSNSAGKQLKPLPVTTPPPVPPENVAVKSFEIKGAPCPPGSRAGESLEIESLKGTYRFHGKTKDGRAYYRHTSPEAHFFVYFDSDCNGRGMTKRWMVSSAEPSTEVLSALQYGPGGGREHSSHTGCNNALSWVDNDSTTMPINIHANYMWCGISVQDTGVWAVDTTDDPMIDCEGAECCTDGTTFEDGKCVIQSYDELLRKCQSGVIEGISCLNIADAAATCK